MARTETVTVVFTDLVSSTELASRLGHDAYQGLRHVMRAFVIPRIHVGLYLALWK